ncbi:carboxypeptidase-like regulatory domain-containing protein [Cellulophaga baltica]|uniref:carboxypeptidase-like regulatory domain-containing protein n=1 Tax=Cellulophaga TaxID=104264 RepID=UPI001C078E6E|nr:MULTISPECIES: carboxypeptidase-like regulatory domain-containing protein [Cellulophaga]MBU2995246.1 carboxypeptidase-like regulatory domain-containing protein [Cellulophaga baltica]MDO6766641.1 carboxypeptidase-like regulatory domain-containing protein [Cellulophaga sp. 1_MG-2023]
MLLTINKLLSITIILALPIGIYSQVNTISAKVIYNDIVLESVTVKNLSSNENTISNNKGLFSLKAAIGDTLHFSYIGMKNLERIITQNDLKNDSLNIQMFEKTVVLEGVEVVEYSSVNSLSLGIISKEKKEFSQYERKLATAGDFKAIHLLSLLGGKLAVDPIINKISGRTKRMKYAIELEKKENRITFLEENYSAYLLDKLKIENGELQLFYTHLIEDENIEKMIENYQHDKFAFFLINEWNSYAQNLIIE